MANAQRLIDSKHTDCRSADGRDGTGEDRGPAEADSIYNNRVLVPRPADVDRAACLSVAVAARTLQ